MKLKVVHDERHVLHKDKWGLHVERPERLLFPLSVLQEQVFADLVEWRKASHPQESSLLGVHDKHFINFIKEESEKGFHYLDPDTYITEHTYEVALSFATSAREAARDSLETKDPWLVLPRPPGHHSGRRGWAMGAPTLGFCIFNHAAVAARELLNLGLKVLMLDFDAHHGNGTQDIFWEEPEVLHIDIHQSGIYPGTGQINDLGGGEAEGTKVNIPLTSGSGDERIAWSVEHIIKPLAELFKPDAIVVSAGFDGYVGEPITTLSITEIGYKILGETVRELWTFSRERALVIVLEGGYEEGLRNGFRSFLEGFLRVGEEVRTKPYMDSRTAELLMNTLKKYWNLK